MRSRTGRKKKIKNGINCLQTRKRLRSGGGDGPGEIRRENVFFDRRDVGDDDDGRGGMSPARGKTLRFCDRHGIRVSPFYTLAAII